jgi:hypothetical protein
MSTTIKIAIAGAVAVVGFLAWRHFRSTSGGLSIGGAGATGPAFQARRGRDAF